MASIDINRAKYRKTKADLTWLDHFLAEQVKEEHEVTKTIKDKEVKSKSSTINAVHLFQLVEANGFNFPKIREQVEAEQVGAIGRARMILAGALKRKIAKGEVIKDRDGNEVEQDEAFVAYRDSITPVAVEAEKTEAA